MSVTSIWVIMMQLKIVAICINSEYNLNEGGELSRKEKLVRRLLSRPFDFTFDELTTLLGHLGYYKETAGKTSGSRVVFSTDDGDIIRLHKPHPENILKLYQINDIVDYLKERGLL